MTSSTTIRITTIVMVFVLLCSSHVVRGWTTATATTASRSTTTSFKRPPVPPRTVPTTPTLQDTITHVQEQTIAKIQEANAQRILEYDDDVVSHHPTIDISSWITSQEEDDDSSSTTSVERQRHDVVRQVMSQVLEAGTFNVKGHGIPHHLLDVINNESTDFFNRPLEDKIKYSVDDPTSPNKGQGYVGKSDDLTLPFLAGNGRSIRQLFEIQTSDFNAPPTLKSALSEYIAHMERLDGVIRQILTAVLIELKNLPTDHSSLTSSSSTDDALLSESCDATNLLRISSYTPNRDEPDGLQFPAHTDTAALTIMRIQMHGMDEIRRGSNGSRWVRIPPNENDDIRIHLGDMMHIWSNGVLPPNVHRVNTNVYGKYGLVFGYVRNGSKVNNVIVGPNEDSVKFVPRLSTEQYKSEAKC